MPARTRSNLSEVTVPLLAPWSGPNRYQVAAELVEQLPRDLAAARQKLRCSVTTQAKSIGVTRLTLAALYAGKQPSRKTIVLALRWLSRQ